MVPTRTLLMAWANAFRTWWVTVLQTPGWSMVLSKTPFTPGPDLGIGDYTADVDWNIFPIPVSDTGWQVGTDPRDQSILVSAHANDGVPAQQSSAATPRNVYGWIVGSSGPFTPQASELLPAVISVASIGAQIVNPQMTFRFPIGMVR